MQQQYGHINMIIMFYTNVQTSNFHLGLQSFVFWLSLALGCSLIICVTTAIRRNVSVRLSGREETIRKKPHNIYEDKSHFQMRSQCWCSKKHCRISNRAGLVLLDVWRLQNCCCLAVCVVQSVVWTPLKNLHSPWVSFCRTLVTLAYELEGEYCCKMLGKASSKGKREKTLKFLVVNVHYRTVKQNSLKKWARRSEKIIKLKTKCYIITSILL